MGREDTGNELHSDVDEPMLFSLTGQYKEKAQMDLAEKNRRIEDRMLVNNGDESIRDDELEEEEKEAWNP